MFGLGMWEVVLVLIVALIVLGPHRLPEVARQIGRTLREFRRAATELQVGLEKVSPPDEIKVDPAAGSVSTQPLSSADGAESGADAHGSEQVLSGKLSPVASPIVPENASVVAPDDSGSAACGIEPGGSTADPSAGTEGGKRG